MTKEKEALAAIAKKRCERVLSYLPRGVRREVFEISRTVSRFWLNLSEIRLRADRTSSLVMGGVCYPLIALVGGEDIRDVMLRLSEGALYTCRDSIADGYIPIGGGVRVGVAGTARYDGGRIVGVGDISALVFRFPATFCEFGEELYRAWLATGSGNMIIASPPMGGKTTALASLASYIGGGRGARRVVIVDERCEFDRDMYEGREVDILSGYKRERGIEMALRTMSPEVLIADEIATTSEADAIMSVLGAGIRVITSVHAEGLEDLYQRPCLKGLIDARLFSSMVILHNDGERYGFDLYLGGA